MAETPSLPALGRAQVAFEVARPALLFAAYAYLAARELWLLAVPVAAACVFGSFVLLHDTMHSSLGLPRTVNELVLAFAGLLMLKSGHGQRATHLRHHGVTLAESDPEAGIINQGFWRVVLAGPFHVLGNRAVAMRISPPTRNHQIAETGLTVLAAAFAVFLYVRFGSPAGLVYWAVVFVISATMTLWAAYIPHTLSTRHWMVRTATALSRWWTPILNTLAFHDLHHQFPRVPTALLSDLMHKVGPEVAFADHTILKPAETRGGTAR